MTKLLQQKLCTLMLAALGIILWWPSGSAQAMSRNALSYQFGATAPNAGGQSAVAVRLRRDRLVFAGFTAPRSAPSGRYGLLAGYRPMFGQPTSWLNFYADISAGFSLVNGSLYNSSASAGSDDYKVHIAPTLEMLWGMRIGWFRVDIANHIYGDPHSLRPWSFPLWVGAVISW